LNTDRVEKWIALVANLAVLVGIVFLALELRQANRIAIASTEISVRGQFKSTNELILNSDDIAQLLVKATNADADLSPVDIERLFAFLFVNLNTWLSIEIAYANGMVTTATFETVLDDIRGMLTYYPALRPLLRESMNDFPSTADTRVRTTISEILADTE